MVSSKLGPRGSLWSGGLPASLRHHPHPIQPSRHSQSWGGVRVPSSTRISHHAVLSGGCPLCSPVGAAVTKRLLGVFGRQRLVLSVRRPEVPNPDTGRATPPLQLLGPQASLGCGSAPHSVSLVTGPSPCVFSLLTGTRVIGAGPTPLHYDIVFIHCLCEDPISK